jgi:hypothetical protein
MLLPHLSVVIKGILFFALAAVVIWIIKIAGCFGSLNIIIAHALVFGIGLITGNILYDLVKHKRNQKT